MCRHCRGPSLVQGFVRGNFLELGGLLAADADTGFEGHDVAGGAEIAHAKQFAIVKGVEPMDLEGAIRLGDSFQAHLAAVQALVLQGVEKVGRVGRKRLFPAVHLQQGTVSAGGQQFTFEHGQRLGLSGPEAGKRERMIARARECSAAPRCR